MKYLAQLVALIVAIASIGCHANTGHSLSTKDLLVIDSTSDWTVTWTLNAPEAGRELQDRIRGAVWNYRIDGGPWHQKAFVITQLDPSNLVIQATVPKADFSGAKEVEAYPIYEFDGTREGARWESNPRKLTIK